MPTIDITSTSYPHYSNAVHGSPGNISDDNLATYVQNFSYAAIDFGSATYASSMRIHVYNSAAGTELEGKTFQGSDDSTNGDDGTWTTILTFSGLPSSGWSSELSFTAVTYRWYRVTGALNNNCLLSEWEIFSDSVIDGLSEGIQASDSFSDNAYNHDISDSAIISDATGYNVSYSVGVSDSAIFSDSVDSEETIADITIVNERFSYKFRLVFPYFVEWIVLDEVFVPIVHEELEVPIITLTARKSNVNQSTISATVGDYDSYISDIISKDGFNFYVYLERYVNNTFYDKKKLWQSELDKINIIITSNEKTIELLANGAYASLPERYVDIETSDIVEYSQIDGIESIKVARPYYINPGQRVRNETYNFLAGDVSYTFTGTSFLLTISESKI